MKVDAFNAAKSRKHSLFSLSVAQVLIEVFPLNAFIYYYLTVQSETIKTLNCTMLPSYEVDRNLFVKHNIVLPSGMSLPYKKQLVVSTSLFARLRSVFITKRVN